jgi:heme/copper-type cytochrome/quinol oxidase subunit 2
MTVGKVYEVTVLNYDSMPHTWTAPGLGVNAVVPAGSRSKPSVTDFTVHPTKAGTYQWFCATPCDAWSMVHNGYMRGYVKVVA